jgi:hypothetical protein
MESHVMWKIAIGVTHVAYEFFDYIFNGRELSSAQQPYL